MYLKLLLLALLFNCYKASAQEQPKVLFNGKGAAISGFGGMMIEFSSIAGKATISTGGGGAMLLNRAFYLGGYGLNLAHDVHKTSNGSLWETSFIQGGLYTGYIVAPHKMLHFAMSAKTGWGVIRMNPENGYLSSAGPVSDNVFTCTPQAEVEMNVAGWFKVNAGLGYRLTSGIDNSFYTKGDFNSPAFTLSFLFGGFK